MSQYLVFFLLGLGSGAVYAGLGMGLVVQYKALGIINFAYGAMATLASFQYDELRQRGDLVFPWVGLPSRVHLGASVAAWAAMSIVLVLSALLGLLLYVAVYRPMRAASPLAKVVASVGVMIVLQAVVVIQFGTEARLPMTILPNETVDLFGITFPRDRFLLALITAAVGLVLWAIYRFTRFGLATRAASETEQGAVLNGVSPGRLAMINSVLVAVLAAVFGIISSPITGLDPTKFTLFIVPALAAALVGRLRLISATAAAGLGIGMLQSQLLFLSMKSWFPQWARSGVVDAVPFILIVGVLVASGNRLPVRGGPTDDSSLLSLRRGERFPVLAVWLVVGAVALIALRDQYRMAVTVTLIGVMIMLSFVVLTGYLGQISLAQGAVAGVAGFAVSKFTTDFGLPFPVAPLLAALVATLAGCIVGIPGLRIRGVQLAVVTLAGAVAIERLVFSNPEVTGGINGAVVVPPSLFGLDLAPLTGDQRPSVAFGLLCLVIAGLLAVAVLAIRRGELGRQLISVRSNERVASSLGIDVVRVKIAGFAVSSFIAGIGGAMLGYHQGSLSVTSFAVFIGLQWLALSYLGGITSISGAFIAALMLPGGVSDAVLTDIWHLGHYHLLLSGLGVVVTAVANPEGLAPKIGDVVRERWAERHSRVHVPARRSADGGSSPPLEGHLAHVGNGSGE